MKSRLTLLIYILFFIQSFGQEVLDSIPETAKTEDSVYTFPFRAKTIISDFRKIDTTLSAEDFEHFNPYNVSRPFDYDLGNLASKNHNKNYKSDFNSNSHMQELGNFGYFSLFKKVEEVPLLNVKGPISELHFMSVYKRGSHFGGYFSQNINENWNYYLAYTRTHSEGKYFRQETIFDNLNFSTNYKTKNSRYKGALVFIWNKSKNEENGGISDSAAFEDNQEPARELVYINLWNSKGFGRKTELYWDHVFNILQDSATKNGLGVYHQLHYNNQYHKFTSTDSLFDDFIIDSTSTLDSNVYHAMINDVGLRWEFGRDNQSRLQLGYSMAQQKYGNDSTLVSNRSTHALKADFNSTFLHGFVIRLNGAYNLSYGGYAGEARLGYHKTNAYEIEAFVRIKDQEAALFHQYFFSNHYFWYNSFNNVNKTELGLQFDWKDIVGVEGTYMTISDYIYNGDNGYPVQFQNQVGVANINVNLKYLTRSNIGFDIKVGANSILEGEEVYRLPELITQSKVYWNFDIPNKPLNGQLGLQLRYFSSYYSDAFNPVNASFQIQNEKEIGDFYYLNMYSSFQLKSFKVYFLLENVLKDLLPYNYYSVPGYPMPDRVFRLGFKWRFFN